MKNKILTLLMVLVLAVFVIACSNEKPEENSNENIVEDMAEELGFDLEEANADVQKKSQSGVVDCGEIYVGDNLSFNVIGVREAEQEEKKYLVINMEVYNESEEIAWFGPMTDMGLVDSKNNECYFDALAPYEGEALAGAIPAGGNKIVGEVAFDISDAVTKDFTLKVGDWMSCNDAINIKEKDIGKTFSEQFEDKGVTSEYTIGTPVQSPGFTITLDGVRVEPKDTVDSKYTKEGMALLVLEMTITNNKEESAYFQEGGIGNISKVCSEDGTELEDEPYGFTLRNGVPASETVKAEFTYYINEKDKNFYMLVRPHMHDYGKLEAIVFSVQ